MVKCELHLDGICSSNIFGLVRRFFSLFSSSSVLRSNIGKLSRSCNFIAFNGVFSSFQVILIIAHSALNRMNLENFLNVFSYSPASSLFLHILENMLWLFKIGQKFIFEFSIWNWKANNKRLRWKIHHYFFHPKVNIVNSVSSPSSN